MKFIFILTLVILYDLQRVDLTCPLTNHRCSNKELFTCISKEWVCDHNQDCEDGSDETGCPKISCNSDEFHCTNSDQCVKQYKVCDGNQDCIDNSDEKYCSSVKKSCNLRTEYDCLNDTATECISLENICDRKKDCSNKKNLNEDCNNNMCRKPNKGSLCSYKCVNKYSSFLCYCPDGMELGKDGLTCIKINPCLEQPNKCEQECTITTDGYVCSCFEGYIKSGDRCVASNSKLVPHMLYSTFNGIYDLELLKETSTTFDKTRKLVPLSDKLLSFDVKISGDDLDIYSTHVENGSVLSLHKITEWNMASKNSKIRKNEDSKNITFPTSFYAVATDSVRNLVFWTDNNASKISVFNASNNDISDIIVDDCYFPLSLVADPISGKIFWIDLGNTVVVPRILMSSMDGTSRVVLISSGLHKPTSLVLDIENQSLYWNDLFPGSIKFLNLKSLSTGIKQIKVIFENYNYFPVSLAIFKNRIYWSDWHQNRIYSVHKISGNGIRTVVEQVQASIINIVSYTSNAHIILKTNDDQSSSVCSGVNNPCQFSCLPGSLKDKRKCFGISHSTKTHSSAWWFILIPIAILLVCAAMFMSRKIKRGNSGNVSVLIRNSDDSVRFWDEGTSEITHDNDEVAVSDSIPILQTV